MESLWDEQEAKQFSQSDLDMRVYTSRLLGRDDNLVLHGGGNTSVKVTEKNIFGENEEILYVKGSGWDLKTIEPAGFSPAKLDVLKRLGTLPHLSDTQMAKELKAALTNPAAPSPSVEAILHAIIPFKFVDHTHTDAVVAISNSVNGEQLIQDIYGPKVLVLPYTMPGFILSKQVFDATQNIEWNDLEGIVLHHHGVFTFNDDGRKSYEKMIELVSKAEDYLKQQDSFDKLNEESYSPAEEDFHTLAQARKEASIHFGHPMIARWKRNTKDVGYSSIEKIEEIATRGPVTPDHSLHTKRIPAVIDQDPAQDIQTFKENYLGYFKEHSTEEHTCLDPAPRFAVWKNKGTIAFAPNPKRAQVVSDIVDHTQKAVQWGESLGGWKALTAKEIFDLEYWELEQAKLKRGASRAEFEGQVVLITGAASGIGQACAHAFMKQGAAVAALDINPKVTELFSGTNALGIECDITSIDSVKAAIHQCIEFFGGIDILVSNAGSFPSSLKLEELDDTNFQKTLDINLNGHVRVMRECIPFLKLGFDPSIVVMASKNVPAPGPGAGAYSASKAALTQMARVAALELGGDGIRVNMLHPNAVFDTGVWTDDVLQKRAENYGLSVEEYKKNNLLKTEITSEHVAQLVTAMAGPAFSKTTGAQVPIDGGNERVI